MTHLPPPSECANCGTDLSPGAKSCRDCGADERTGWRDTDMYDGLDLPSEAWEDDTDVGPALSRELPWYWWTAGVAVLIGFIFVVLGLN